MNYDVIFSDRGADLKLQDGSGIRRVYHNIDLSTVRGGLKEFNGSEFLACLCCSPRDRSADFARIRCKASGLPIGWYIPALYFEEPEEFASERFLADFAYAGFLKYWNDPAFSDVRSHFHHNVSPGERSFPDELPSGLGIVVFSRENLKKSKLQISAIKISLMKSDIWVFDGNIPFDRFLSSAKVMTDGMPVKPIKNIHVTSLKSHCRGVDGLLCHVLDRALVEISGVGGFLYLYQVAEHLMEVNFADAVESLHSEKMPAWELKSRLSKLTSERYRLRDIAGQAQRNGAASTIFDSLRIECDIFIKQCNDYRKDESKTWIDKVYNTRNLIIHNHLSVLRTKSDSRLESINRIFFKAILELISHY